MTNFPALRDSEPKRAYYAEECVRHGAHVTSDKLVYDPFPLIEKESDKILLRSIAKGMPIMQEVIYQDRPCKTICAKDKTNEQFVIQQDKK